MEKYPDQYLFKTYPKNEIKKWVRTLKYAFFKRAWGGHAGDGDEFEICLRFRDKAELFDILKVVGVELKNIPEHCSKPIQGKSYTGEEFQKFKTEIKDYPKFEQPLHTKINSIPCFIWIENGKISITFSGAKGGNLYQVSNEDFQNCLKVERIITDMKLKKYVSTEYEDDMRYISKNNYPELFD